VTASGTLENYGVALNWDVAPGINLRAAVNDEELPTPPSLLRDPIVVTENYRVFDFIRQETVLVRYLTGGNPGLPTERRRTTKIEGTFSPFGSLDLTFNGQYQKSLSRNSIAALPPASVEVQSAFPERYIRDASGSLVQLDARPVSFARDSLEYLRWGFDFRRTFGGASSGGTEGSDEESAPSLGAGWRIAVRADHTWYMDNTRVIRRGLPIIDLLAGGASGYGGGQPRHQVQASTAAYHRGIGLQLFATWNSRSLINGGSLAAPSSIVFASRSKIDVRAFANLGPLFPKIDSFKKARLSFEVLNLLDSKQRVRDTAGSTPLRYQPFLIDPVGRSVRLSLRKAF